MLLQELMSGSRTMGNAVERRTAIRYPLRAPVVFKSVDHHRAAPEAGFVQDISTEGVCVSVSYTHLDVYKRQQEIRAVASV